MTFSPSTFKSHFPLFSQPENQSLVYLDNAATTQKPQCVIDAITQFYLTENGNAQRASHRLARAATERVESVRQQAADFLGAASSEEVVFTSGSTAGLNLLAYGLSSLCKAGDNIVLSHAEHHANFVPWQRLAEQAGCELRFFPEEQGMPVWSRWQEVVDQHTRIVALSGASNVLGLMTDLSIIAAMKQQFPGLMTVLDAAQLAAHRPMDCEAWQCDFAVCSAHKLYGPTGVGLLYGKQPLLATLEPQLVGGEMVTTVNRDASDFVSGVQRFEAGTSSLAAIAGLGACLDFWQIQDRTAMAQYENQLTGYLHHHLQELCARYGELQLISQAVNNVGIATLAVQSEEFAVTDIAHYLDEHNIAVRVGHHCAQPLWQSLSEVWGQSQGLRISLAAYNTEQDIDCLIEVLEAFLKLHQDQSLMPDILPESALTELEQQSSWQKRYKVLLRLGAGITKKPEIRQAECRVEGCETDVWLQHYTEHGRHYFLVDSDSNVIKGLSALLLLWLNGKSTEDALSVDISDQIQQLGLQKHLSASRINGFRALCQKMISCVHNTEV